MKNLKVSFNNLDKVNNIKYLIESLNEVHSGKMYILSEKVKQFENKWAQYCSAKYCIGVNSGTDALILALQVVGIKNGDLVITVANSAPATVISICLLGAIPVFIDINKQGLMNIDQIAEAYYKFQGIKAVIPVHLYGKSCDMKKLTEITNNLKIKVIEDSCQSHGTKLKGDISCSSFFPTKPLGAIGDGGAIVTNNKHHYNKLKRLRNYGMQNSDDLPIMLGRNSRLDEIQANVLLKKLPFLNRWNEERRKLFEYYIKKLKKIKVNPVFENIDKTHSCHLFPILTENPVTIGKRLLKHGIQTKIRYKLFLPSFYKYYIYDIKKTKDFCSKVLCLPLWNGMTKNMINYIVDKLERR